MSEKLNQWCGGYKDGMIKSWDLVTRQYPEIAGQGSSARTIQQASKKWYIFSPNTVKNCGIAAFKVGYHATKEDGLFMDYYQKKKTGTGLKTTLCDQTKKLKKDLKKKHRGMSDQYADEATLTSEAAIRGMALAFGAAVLEFIGSVDPRVWLSNKTQVELSLLAYK